MKSVGRPRSARGQREAAVQLTREHNKLRGSLLDAAVAGVVLSFNPRDSEMREVAERSWKRIRALLSEHLLGEESTILPWAEKLALLSQTTTRRFRARHEELRALVRRVDAVSFAHSRTNEVASAGSALRALAVKLDDIIEDEAGGFMPILRHCTFATSNESPADHASNC